MTRPGPDFLLQQKVYDAFREVEEHLRKHEMIIAAHPDDLDDDLRARIRSAPLTTLRESRFVRRGTLYVIHPGLLSDLGGDPKAGAE